MSLERDKKLFKLQMGLVESNSMGACHMLAALM